MTEPLQLCLSGVTKSFGEKVEMVCIKHFLDQVKPAYSDFKPSMKYWILSCDGQEIFKEIESFLQNNLIKDHGYYIILAISNAVDLNRVKVFKEKYKWFPDDIIRTDASQEELMVAIGKMLTTLSLYSEAAILNQTFDYAYNSIVITDKNGVIEYANKFFQRLTGYTHDELKGGHPNLIKSGYHTGNFYKELWSTIESGQMWEGVFVNKRKNGELFYEEARIVPIVLNHIGQDIRYLKIGRNVNRELLHMKELSQEANIAKKLMMAFLPEYFEDDYLKVSHAIRPFNYLGGDFIVFSKVGEKKYRYAMIDIMGHGISSTLVGIRCSSVFQSLSDYSDLATSVGVVNDMMSDLNLEEEALTKYASGIFLEIDFEKNYIDYISAGHNDFLVKREDNSIDSRISNNLLMGVHKGFKFRVDRISTNHVKGLLLFTDGLIEFDAVNEPDDVILSIVKNYRKYEKLNKRFSNIASSIDYIMDATLSGVSLKDDVAISEIKIK